MKVLHLSNSDSGGAGRATLRLHQGLRGLGIDSKILVQFKSGDDGSSTSSTEQFRKAVL
jgi:hypothetical protein